MLMAEVHMLFVELSEAAQLFKPLNQALRGCKGAQEPHSEDPTSLWVTVSSGRSFCGATCDHLSVVIHLWRSLSPQRVVVH